MKDVAESVLLLYGEG